MVPNRLFGTMGYNTAMIKTDQANETRYQPLPDIPATKEEKDPFLSWATVTLVGTAIILVTVLSILKDKDSDKSHKARSPISPTPPSGQENKSNSSR